MSYSAKNFDEIVAMPMAIVRRPRQMVEVEKLRHEGLQLFKSLVKCGASWQGDILSHRWAELLVFPDGIDEEILEVLGAYENQVHYVFTPDKNGVFVA